MQTLVGPVLAVKCDATGCGTLGYLFISAVPGPSSACRLATGCL